MSKYVMTQKHRENLHTIIQKQWDDGVRVPYVRTEEHKRLMAEKCRVASLKKWRDPEWREITVKALRSPERRKKLSIALKGRKFSKETRKKMSAAQKRKWQDDPVFRQMRRAIYDSEGYRKKLSECSKCQHQIQNERKRIMFDARLVADDQFSYIKGCIEGDGWFGARDVHLATVDEDWAIYFLTILKNWSSVKPTLRIRKIPSYHNQFLVSLNNRFIMEFIKENEPSSLLEFIKGFYDAEGGFYFDKKNHFVSLTNSNIKLLHKIRNFLLSHGVQAYIYEKPIRNGRVGNRIVFARKQTYTLRIANNKGIFWFYKNVGFRIGRKQRRLEECVKWLQSFHRRRYLESEVYG